MKLGKGVNEFAFVTHFKFSQFHPAGNQKAGADSM